MKIYPIGTKLIHKACKLKIQIVDYKEDLFGKWVVVKALENFTTIKNGTLTTYDLSILNEYKEVLEDGR